jgi:hypothetical protein
MQDQGASFGISKAKSWPMPDGGDIRAEPKVGVEIYDDDGYCLHGYAGVDGKVMWCVMCAAWPYAITPTLVLTP